MVDQNIFRFDNFVQPYFCYQPLVGILLNIIIQQDIKDRDLLLFIDVPKYFFDELEVEGGAALFLVQVVDKLDVLGVEEACFPLYELDEVQQLQLLPHYLLQLRLPAPPLLNNLPLVPNQLKPNVKGILILAHSLVEVAQDVKSLELQENFE